MAPTTANAIQVHPTTLSHRNVRLIQHVGTLRLTLRCAIGIYRLTRRTKWRADHIVLGVRDNNNWAIVIL
eukprot:934444-Prorocentrum_lima.AAC.1